MILLTGCANEVKYVELNKRLTEMKEENSVLNNQIDTLQKSIEGLEEKIKLIKGSDELVDQEILDNNVWTKNLSNVTVEYRNDIRSIFEQLDEIDGTNGFRYFGDSSFTDSEKENILTAISGYLNDTFDGGLEAYQSKEYIGGKPSPYNLNAIIGIVDNSYDEAGASKGDYEDKNKYLKVYFYKSELWCSEEGVYTPEEPYYIYRGPFTAMSFLYMTMEEKGGEWIVAYIGSD